MKILVLFLIAVLACVHANEQDDLYQKWAEFQMRYNKSYRSVNEASRRLGIFEKNLKEIDSHNVLFDQGIVTYTKGVNQFADWTKKEFLRYVNKGKVNKPKGTQKFYNNTEDLDGFVLPGSIDWRKKRAVTPVKDQGDCGSSWAFTSVGSIEGLYAVTEKKLVSFSEQQLVDCSNSYGNLGCNGGEITSAFEYVIDNGITSEIEYPYNGRQGTCKNKTKIVTKVKRYISIESGDEKAIQKAVATRGPVAAAIHATNEFQFYSSGILDDKTCNSEDLNHGVLVVGYGGLILNKYYILKNSWGPDWGESGYLRLPMFKKNKCGIATGASYPVV